MERCPYAGDATELPPDHPRVPGMGPKKPEEPTLDTGDIQADVLLGVNMKKHLIVVYLDVTSASAAKAWLRDEILPHVTTADNMHAFRDRFKEARKEAKDGTKPVLSNSATLNIAFSYAGLEALDAPDVEKFHGPGKFGTAFSLGLEKRAGILGDVAAGHAPSTWITGPRTPHILLQIGADLKADYDAFHARFSSEAALSRNGVKVIHLDAAHRLNELGSEQFGFHDALSNPGLRGYYSDGQTHIQPRVHPLDTDHGLPGQDLVYPGEFVILKDRTTGSAWTEGLAGDGGARKPSSETFASKYESSLPDWATNGAFLVNRRLRQDVAGFWKWCGEEAKGSSGGFTQEALAAKIFGRWPSGCPLSRSPEHDLTDLGADARANNAYAFAVPHAIRTAPEDKYPKATSIDLDGSVCPLGAHTRKMNPRDGVNDVSTPLRRRIMRRGLPYGPPLANRRSGVDDGVDRGLQFVAYCSSIEEQFEFLQKKWANSASSPTDPTCIDPIIGQVAKGASKPFTFTDANGKEHKVDAQSAGKGGASQFVVATGGGYFFAPSMSALMLLSKAGDVMAPVPRSVVGDAVKKPFVYNFPGKLTDLPPSAQAGWSGAVHDLFTNTISRIKYYGEVPNYFSIVDHPNAMLMSTHRVSWDGFAHKFTARYASDKEVFQAGDQLEKGDAIAAKLLEERKRVDPGHNPEEINHPVARLLTGDVRRERCGGCGVPVEDPEYKRPLSRQMDEYCEWHAVKDESGTIIRVDVTTELPEYWAYMHTVDPKTVLALYHQHISKDVKEADLLDEDQV